MQGGTEAGTITVLLRRAKNGDRAAWETAVKIVYPELRRLARSYMRREQAERLLQPTALVHEAFLRLMPQQERGWENRIHFLSAAAQAMRRILVEHARQRLTEKRDVEIADAPVEDLPQLSAAQCAELVALEDAVVELERLSPRQSRVVELRYFGGLTVEETAAVLGVTSRTVDRDWSVARAFLRRQIRG